MPPGVLTSAHTELTQVGAQGSKINVYRPKDCFSKLSVKVCMSNQGPMCILGRTNLTLSWAVGNKRRKKKFSYTNFD